jgi:hypothetical protein
LKEETKDQKETSLCFLMDPKNKSGRAELEKFFQA